MKFSNYKPAEYYDELFHTDGTVRDGARKLIDQIESLPRITSYNVCYTKLLRVWI